MFSFKCLLLSVVGIVCYGTTFGEQQSPTFHHDASTELARLIVRRLDEFSEHPCNRTVRKVVSYNEESSSVTVVGGLTEIFRTLTIELCSNRRQCEYEIKLDDDPSLLLSAADDCKTCTVRLAKLSTEQYSRILNGGYDCDSYQIPSSSLLLEISTADSSRFVEKARQKKLRNLFERFARIHNRTYADTEEKEKRFELFKGHLKRVDAARTAEKGSAKHGITHFSDMTAEEIARYSGTIVVQEMSPPAMITKPSLLLLLNSSEVAADDTFDWREKRAVTPVKNQGNCGDCWAFSVMAVLESQYYLKHGKLISFSEQQLLDCDRTDHGCNGGFPLAAMVFLSAFGGIETDVDYPYAAVSSGSCNFDSDKSVARVSNVAGIRTDNETVIATYLQQVGPLSVVVNADAMLTYIGGVSYPDSKLCDPNKLNHAVVLVGHSVEQATGLPYWIIKNSWGDWWGENGYYYLYKGAGVCGVNKYVSIGFVA